MTLKIHNPSAPLAQYIEMMWEWEGYQPPHQQERILPHGAMELTINLNNRPMTVTYPTQAKHQRDIHGAMVSGARSEYFVIDTAQPVFILSVLFKAGAAGQFFGVPAHKLHNCHVPLDTLWGYGVQALMNQLYDATSTASRFAILETEFCRRLARMQGGHRAVDGSLAMFYAMPPHNNTIASVQAQTGLSATRFIQLFRQYVGVTPKMFCRVQRFWQSVHHIANTPNPEWATLALDYGYYDQSHFINDFKQFAGITPTQYAPQDREHPGNLAYIDTSGG